MNVLILSHKNCIFAYCLSVRDFEPFVRGLFLVSKCCFETFIATEHFTLTQVNPCVTTSTDNMEMIIILFSA